MSGTAKLTADQQVVARLCVFDGKAIGPAKVTSSAGNAVGVAKGDATHRVAAGAAVTSNADKAIGPAMGSTAPPLGISDGAAVTCSPRPAAGEEKEENVSFDEK